MKELFSRRYRDKSGDPEVYIYNNFSQEFRNQCFHIVRDFINEMQKTTSVNVAEFICKKFAREKGLKYIEGYRYINDLDAISKYFDRSSNEDFFDFVDFRVIYYFFVVFLHALQKFVGSISGNISSLLQSLPSRDIFLFL